MADAALSIKIGADTQAAVAGINQVQGKLSNLYAQLDAAKSRQDKLIDPGNIKAAGDEISKITKQIDAVGHNQGFVNLEKSSRGVLEPLNNAYNSIRKIAYALPGIGISGIFLLGFEAIKTAAEALGFFNKEAVTATSILSEANKTFDKSVQSLLELKENVKLAKEGFLNQDQVVKEYNDTLGKTLGRVTTLGEVEEKLSKQGDNYIKFTLLKAAAQVAYGKASQAAFDAAVEGQKKADEFSKTLVDTRITAFGSQTFNAADFDAETKRIAQAQEARKQAAIKAAKDTEDKLLAIGNDFQKQAAEIASKNNFNFFQDTIAPKPIKVKVIPEVVEPDPQHEALRLGTFLDTSRFDENFKVLQTKLDKNPVKLTFRADIQKIMDDAEKMKDVGERLGAILTREIDRSISNIAGTLGEALGSGGNVFKAAGSALLQQMGELLKQLGAGLIKIGVIESALKALGKLSPVAQIAIGVAAEIAGGALISAATKQHAFAEGGIVTGPTNALIGEAGPEVVFPLDKLNRFIKSSTSDSRMEIVGRSQIEGEHIVLLYNRAIKNRGYT